MSNQNAIVLGQNVKATATGKKLVIEVDLTQELGLSSSGQNMMIAKTGGNKPIATPAGTVTVGLNIYKPAE